MYTSRPWQPPGVPLGSNAPFTDIGTAVYPCLRVHAVHRPFRCAACPASFARNHDLKRHAKLHDKKAWQCAGCDKMFSRRDAIKRHKNNSRARGGKGEVCVSAAIREVELDKEAEDEIVREGRRAKMWSDIVGSQIGGAVAYGTSVEHSGLEEGEIRRELVGRVRSAVMSLHGVLQAHVSSALGTPSDQAVPPLHLDPTGGQATLASVIARAQLQALPSQMQPPQGPPIAQHSHAESPAASASRDGHVTGYDDIQADYATAQDDLQPLPSTSPGPALSLYGLSEEQTKLLEQAIANAASAAQAQAEAEAAMEEEEDDYEEDEEEYEEENQAISIPA
ncbi:hypothetical protein SERLADRAFT_466805 [Serpula lacrymans var. lacrymans S7.9]|uniref:C2H2-type domain-containing protein n=1 Tax=Serpula lacrymans var. lacrymans (strain S7.9) TaxID=578457 RepID=F8NUZ2_SERL9|nr:uncharacterized protein SERLADRAFT_466805 [Serpula lacrymans var. lacrymans S7.9]EGO25947.1 hypothetical protein SERLADRAFT_466805 [Serpula lacrymans var. lacrymans S7.9]